MRIATWNVNSVRQRLQHLVAYLKEIQPDVLCLQEIKCLDEQFPKLEIEELGYNIETHGQKSFNGVAILSRLPLHNARSRPLPGAPDREPRTDLTADVEMRPGLPMLQFSTTHLDQGFDIASRLAQVRFLNATVAPDEEQPAILAGDLNSQADSAVVSVLHQVWCDMFTAPEPLGPQGLPRRRVDHVLARPAARWHTDDAQIVDDRIASDHRPVIVTLEWEG